MNEKRDRKVRRGLSESEAEARRKLVDWMCELGDTTQLSSECVHRAVAYLDTIMGENTVAQSDAHAVAVVCMLVAGKLTEKDAVVSRVAGLLTRKLSCPRASIMQYEVQIMSLLHWDMQGVTALDFVELLVAQGVVFTTDSLLATANTEQIAKSTRQYAEFFADLCLQEATLSQTDPLRLAGGILAAARRSMGFGRVWPFELEALTGLSLAEVDWQFNTIMRSYERMFPQGQPQTRMEESDKENCGPRPEKKSCTVGAKRRRCQHKE